MIGAAGPTGGVGEGIGGRGPGDGGANRVAKLRVIEVLTLGVEFEKCVGVVAGVRLRRRVEEIALLRIHGKWPQKKTQKSRKKISVNSEAKG